MTFIPSTNNLTPRTVRPILGRLIGVPLANWGDKPGAQSRFLAPVSPVSPGFSPQFRPIYATLVG
jgi:hypothetical protein